MVVVTEGMTDALSAAEAGYDAVALLGTGVVDERVASAISRRWRTERLVVAFDADHAGRIATVGLLDFFVRKGAGHRAAFISVPNSVGDLNAWLQADGPAFSARLSATLEAASPVGQNLRGSWRESLAAEPSQVRDSFGRISGPSLGL
jgi:DNA primase